MYSRETVGAGPAEQAEVEVVLIWKLILGLMQPNSHLNVSSKQRKVVTVCGVCTSLMVWFKFKFAEHKPQFPVTYRVQQISEWLPFLFLIIRF